MGDLASFSDGFYPSLRYFNGHHGSYSGYHFRWRNAGLSCQPEGSVGFTLDPETFGHGLDMAKDEHFNAPHTRYEVAVAWAKRHLHDTAKFEGSFSAYNRGSTIAGSVKFDVATVKLWGYLQTALVCDATGPETTAAAAWSLLAVTPLTHPVDTHGSMAPTDASWSSVGAKWRVMGTNPDVEGEAFLATGFCERHEVRLWRSSSGAGTASKITLNYKDKFDTSDGSSTPLEEQLASAPTTESVFFNCDTPFEGGFLSDPLPVYPQGNNRQQIWIQASGVRVLSKRRVGNCGFPQLDHMKESVVWEGGSAGEKVFKGFRKNTAWYAKLQFIYTASMGSSGACPPVCSTIDGDTLNFATEMQMEQVVDPAVVYTWDRLCEIIADKQPWNYISAESSQGSEVIDVPTGLATGAFFGWTPYDRPPRWGSVGWDSATATTATRARSQTLERRYIAVLTQSWVPTRSLYGEARQQQDYWSDFFMQNQATEEELAETPDLYYGDGCKDNQVCGSFTCDEPRLSNERHRAGGEVTDSFYGYSDIAVVGPPFSVTRTFTHAGMGFYGEELPALYDNEDPPNLLGYDTSQLLSGETADAIGPTNPSGTGRILSPILVTDIFVVDPPATGYYVALKNFTVI
jgi:hypothetical protein